MAKYKQIEDVINECDKYSDYTDNMRKYYIFQCGFEVGLRNAKLTNCKDSDCSTCSIRNTCAIALEAIFFSIIYDRIKSNGKDDAIEYVVELTKNARDKLKSLYDNIDDDNSMYV